MIRNRVRSLLGRPATKPLPYGMFDHDRTAEQAKQARILEKVYHKGQERIWDGHAILDELVAKHGRPNLPPDKAKAVRTLFAVILWGELAAWKVSAELALRIDPLEAKLAATSQAHDEARHFYVMHDYLALLDYVPGDLPPIASRTLVEVLNADSLTKKLMGMQLMVEPIALTIFQLVRERRLEPVLADLLQYYERDEARHVALGVNHLPALLQGISAFEAADLVLWEMRMFDWQIRGMEELRESFECLGLPAREVLRLGQAKQLLAFRAMSKELRGDSRRLEWIKTLFDFRIEIAYPEAGAPETRLGRVIHAARRSMEGVAPTETTLAHAEV